MKTKYNKEFIKEFREAYASIIYDMCNSHTFHDDSACFFEAMCQRYTTDRFKYFTYIYQPTFVREEWQLKFQISLFYQLKFFYKKN